MTTGSTAIKAAEIKPVSQLTVQPEIEPWQKVLAGAIRDPMVLLELLELSSEQYKKLVVLPEKFKLLVPLSYVKKMQKGNWNDPLLKQVLPLKDEQQESVFGFTTDPVADLNAEVSSGVLQKYQGRVLLVTTGSCAVHCRYCFRQHFPYVNSLADKKHWQQTLSTLANDDSIHEVILSGGDPLMLNDQRLQLMCYEIAEIPHIKTLRFHTRVPIFLPERINSVFLEWLEEINIQKVMVIHANHANELDEQVGNVLLGLKQAGVTLLNQSVLLKRVNDDLESLTSLSHKLFEFGVLPYYLHQLDKVKGAAHFEVDKSKGYSLVEQLKNSLSGYLVPKYVEEVSGERSKQAIEKTSI